MHQESSLVREVFFALCKTADTPISLGLWLRFKYDQRALAEFDMPIGTYLDRERFEADYLCASFLSKWKGLVTGIDLEAEAMKKFTSSEVQCRETNERIRRSRLKGFDPFTESVLFTAQRKIARLLGPFSLFAVERGFGWGPGATDDIRRREAFLDTKMCKLPIPVTRRALTIAQSVISSDLHWSAALLGVPVEFLDRSSFELPLECFHLTEEAIVELVPKNAKTHRTIAKEPRMNGFLQKGVGQYIRRRLKRVGIDLDDQGANQEGARRAYTDQLATLDLKAASDSVSAELVYELLPVDWAMFMDDIRSHRMRQPDGTVIELEKFSSMGNGFTFELESLIFWALTTSVVECSQTEGEVLVYGDDILCPRACAREVVDLLALLGFTVNESKSFIDGNFFESCGKHYFHGYDVTPCYQKERIESSHELLRMANRLMRASLRLSDNGILHRVPSQAWAVCWRAGGESRRFQLPLGAEGDDGWVVTADDFAIRPFDINFGFRCRVISSSVKRLPADDAALLAWSLRRGVQTESPFGGYVTTPPESRSDERLVEAFRWVMPTGEFGTGR